MHSNKVENPQKSLQIKQDDKFYSRLMSKEASMANSSSRVYYGGASGAVPFIWESQPGTPKHALYDDNALPPLTPPPSYQSASKSKTINKNSKPDSLFTTIFPRLTSKKKNHGSPSSFSWSCKSSSSSSSSSSSWSSSCSSNSTNSKFHRRQCSCSTLPNRFGTDDDHHHEDQQSHQGHGSPTSTLCSSRKRRSCYSIMKMKNPCWPL